MTAGSKTVNVFTSKGGFIRKFEVAIERLIGLENLAITTDGNVYINDVGGSQIVVQDDKGKVLSRFSRDIGGAYNMVAPAGLSGGLDDKIVVSSHSIAVLEAIKY